MRKSFLASVFLASLALAVNVHAASGPDLSLKAANIRFNKEVLYSGDTVRIYATIKNVGDTDAAAQVFFYQGAILIGGSQAVSVVADGAGDDVFVDFTVPTGAFNIRAVIQGADPQDINSSNDVATTPLYEPKVDADRDGVGDDTDNCPTDANTDQLDTDHDGKGNACDSDDDNDGLSDADEATKGTSPTLSDTDGDGVPDGSDDYPTDATRSKKPVAPAPVVKTEPVKAPASVQPASVAPAKPVTTAKPAEEVSVPIEIAAAETPVDAVPLVLGATKASPDARFTYKEIDWRTYEFEATPPEGQGGLTYGWDFGDGATSVQAKITHAFPRAGNYTVTLGIVDTDGNVTSDAQVLDISFFHLDNPLVQLTLGLLLVILLGLLVFIIRLRRHAV